MVLVKPSPYATVAPFLETGDLPSWVPDIEERTRVASYAFYERIWRNVQDAFKLVQRGSEDNPIYIPSAKKCIDATNRYLGVGFNWTLSGGSEADRLLASDAIDVLFKREKFRSKFSSLKRFGLIRGDALWHIVADSTAPVGRRISMHELDPSKYHPIYDPDDIDKLTGVHIVEQWVDPADKNKAYVRRQTYRKVPVVNGPNKITSELTIFEADGWDDRQVLLNPDYKLKPFKSITKQFELPEQISSIPVYHVPNGYQGGHPFGISDLSGFERVIAAINQSINDEDLTLALDGLGVYWTTAPRPSGGWALGPGSVIEGSDAEGFERVSGVANVKPSQDHLGYLGRELKEAMGTPDIAIGNVDVSIAQSGIALALQMSPIISRNMEKEETILAVHDNLFFDLINGWFPAYDELSLSGLISSNPMFASPMPVDRDAVIKEVLALLTSTPPVISVQYARKLLTEKLGYEFPSEMDADIIAVMETQSKANAFDSFEERIRAELASQAGEVGIVVGS